MQQSYSSINGKTKIYGLFADPVEHLQAPAVFNEIIAKRNVNSVFVSAQ